MFGLSEIQNEAGLFLRDTNNTYEKEVKLCWEEMLRNLPREYFSINLARDIAYEFLPGVQVYDDPLIRNIQKIYHIRYLWGTIWMYLSRVGTNDTDIFADEYTPRSFPFFYESAAGRLKIYPAPQTPLKVMITASLGVWDPDSQDCDSDCVRISDKYRTFCRNYVLNLLFMNILQDDANAAKMDIQLKSERQKPLEIAVRGVMPVSADSGNALPPAANPATLPSSEL